MRAVRRSHTMSMWPTDSGTSARMKRVRQVATGPELSVRMALRGIGMRFKSGNRTILGTPDLSNKRQRCLLFVHGCFWHGHPGCSRATIPTRNRAAWIRKVRSNQMRDRRVERTLRRQGYSVLVVWECETRASARLRLRLEAFVQRALKGTQRRPDLK
jgi:DNA mismatch endonuclease, patch repair protein